MLATQICIRACSRLCSVFAAVSGRNGNAFVHAGNTPRNSRDYIIYIIKTLG